MLQYVVRVVKVTNNALETDLNEMAQQGWEMDTVMEGIGKFTVIYKRYAVPETVMSKSVIKRRALQAEVPVEILEPA